MSNNRAKLSPKHREALEMFAKSVPAGAERNPDEFELPVDKPQDELDHEQEQEPVQDEVEQDQEPEQESDDWVDELTTISPEQEDPSDEQPPTEQEAGESDEDYIARLRAEFNELEHIDAEVADEFLDRVVEPYIQRTNAKTQAELESLRRELEQVRDNTSTLTTERVAKRTAEINEPIIKKHPKAEKILQSQEFMDFVNQGTKPYDSETKFQTLSRAYYLGHSDYVIEQLDAFVASKKKPAPAVSVDTGKTSSAPSDKKPKRMTEQEFLAKRRAIMANPRKYPQGTLRKLELDFFSQK